MEGLLKKLGQFSIGPIVGALIGFITVPIITYFISPEGIWKVQYVYFGNIDFAIIRFFRNGSSLYETVL